MKLKDLNITGLEVIGDIALSVIDDKGKPYMIPDTDTSTIENGTVCEIVNEITIEGDMLTWSKGTINLDQEIN